MVVDTGNTEGTVTNLIALREKNRQERAENIPLTQPSYPSPYNDPTYDEAELFFAEDGLKRSEVFPTIWQHYDEDPFSPHVLRDAEALIRKFRLAVPYPEWSTRIGNYPVPDVLNMQAACVDTFPYAQLELRTATLILMLWGEEISLIDLRAYCLSMLDQERHPVHELTTFYKRKIDNILIYLRAIARKCGYDPYELKKGLVGLQSKG